jgi:hypothetical protein
MFAILEEAEGLRHWVRIESHNSTAFISARRPPPAHFLYAARNAAEHDAEIFRATNAHEVEGGKHKSAPATYSVVPIE